MNKNIFKCQKWHTVCAKSGTHTRLISILYVLKVALVVRFLYFLYVLKMAHLYIYIPYQGIFSGVSVSVYFGFVLVLFLFSFCFCQSLLSIEFYIRSRVSISKTPAAYPASGFTNKTEWTD
jgi:hypothetical protein